MDSDTPELGLDLRLCAAKAADGLVRALPATIAGGERRAARLEETLLGLEEERAKIEAFKRELPLSIRIVADAIEILRDDLKECRSERCNVLEEFMPVKSKFDGEGGEKLEKDCRDKMNWMSSAQLWSDNYSDTNDNNNITTKKTIHEESENPSLEPKGRTCGGGGGGGAFVPFKALTTTSRKEDKISVALPDLTLLSAGVKGSRPAPAVAEELHWGGSSTKVRAPVSSPLCSQLSLQAQQQLQQSSRKARRCWSPELHRRFVLALQQLGGAQVATPKQIRELMKVDGLTNDEVKSHLQKYRLHTRKAPNSSAQVYRPMVLVGGLWVPQDHYPASSQQSASQSGSPQGPLQLAGSARAVSVTAGDSCEEDGKSESYSWK